MAVTQIAFVGDSLTQGTGNSEAISTGGSGSWFELVADRLSLTPAGPLLSSGFRSVALSINTSEWAFNTITGNTASGWKAVASTDLFDRLPYGYGWYSSAGSSVTATYTIPAAYDRPVVGFACYWVDYSGGGNWQYRVDGGTWTNMGQTRTSNAGLKKFYVSGTVTSTVDFRPHDGTTNAGCFPAGVEMFYYAPSTTTGLIVHDVGVSGETLHHLVASGTSGDRMAWFDSVTLGTGSPIANTPTYTILMHINDAGTANSPNVTTWAADLSTFNTRAAAVSIVGYMNPWEADTATYTAVNQSNYRAQTKTSAAGFSPVSQVLDFFDAWTPRGWTNNAALVADGVLFDAVHESAYGHGEITPLVYWFVRRNFVT